MSAVAVLGCGYVGRRIAKQEITDGRSVIAGVASQASQRALSDQGLVSVQVDFDQASAPLAACAFDTVYYLVPPPPRGTTDSRSRTAVDYLRNASISHVVLISTTGVYGDCGGEWVDESRAINPGADRSLRRVDAENTWRVWAAGRGITVSVLRVAGIYAADRLPEQRIRAGTPVLAAAESPYSNRIHADDLVRICMTAASKRFDGALNVADDNPTTMTDYFFRVADALDLPRPPEISMNEATRQFTAAMMSYLNESRRIDNTALKRELELTLRYPTLSEGLAEP